MVIAIIDILLNLSGLSRSGGKKSKYSIPEKLKRLLSPEKKVSLTPYPNIGNIRSGIKFFIDEANIIMMLRKIIGEIIRFALAITFRENLLQIKLLIIKNNVIKSMGDVLKYMVLRVSDKLLIMDVVSIINNVIYAIPIIIFKVFPPVNSLISSISLPGKFLNKEVISHTKAIAIIDI